MAYDAARNVTLLFGGEYPGDLAPTALNDLWAWDGQDWTQLPTRLTPSPELAFGAQLAYLPELQAVILVGDFFQKSCAIPGCQLGEETQVWALTDRSLNYLPMIAR